MIGVITSPTGAVIRDILHRLADRFPRHVLLWPVAVQGEQAAAQVAAAIAGFNSLAPGGPVPRPDLIIVARGGGSLEDLMAFNEEVVVRAAAASVIPLISAVGHETDTTLIDYASDLRAPTPTAAAELAVPVRAELLAQLLDLERRSLRGLTRGLTERRTRLEGLARGLGDPRALINERAQRLDDRGERLSRAIATLTERGRTRLERLAAAIRHPREKLAEARARLATEARALPAALRSAARLEERRVRLEGLGQLLESYSYKGVLARGFALISDPQHRPLTTAAEAAKAPALTLTFHDGTVTAHPSGTTPPPTVPHKPKRPAPASSGGQGSLF